MARRQNDLEFALQLADLADAMTMAAFTGHALEFEEKSDGTPVTETDRHVEERLRAAIAEQRPGDGFLGEETGARDMPSGGRRWIVDPVDGTASFIRGGRSWGTQIALEHDGELVVGVTSAPVLRARWWGADGIGVFQRTRDDPEPRQLRVSSPADGATLKWVCYPRIDRLSADWRALPDRLQAVSAPVRSTSHGALMVAAGTADACLQVQGAPWDYAAFAALVHIAGGTFSYLDGSTELEGLRPAVFSNRKVHDQVLDALGRT